MIFHSDISITPRAGAKSAKFGLSFPYLDVLISCYTMLHSDIDT